MEAKMNDDRIKDLEADSAGGGGVAEGGGSIWRDDALGCDTAPEGFLRAARS